MANLKLLPRWVPKLLLTTVWAGVVASGFWLLRGYEATPGPKGAPPSIWPAASNIPPAADRPTLLVFAHPRCPCTRATLGELALIMTHCQGQVEARVLFFKPSGLTAAWEQTDTWRSAAQIPGVKVAFDLDGEEAARFSALTSGHTLLYGREGRLLFTGGITASRGHAGDNLGRSTIVALVTGGSAETKETCVYGCSIAEDRVQVRSRR